MKLKVGLIITLITFAIGLSVWSSYRSFYQETRLELPNAQWEEIFFKGINVVTELSNLKELRKSNLANNDLEIRVWRGFDLSPLEGVILQRVGGQWLAIHVTSDHYAEPKKAEAEKLNSPKSGWDKFWSRVVDQGILTLPDASQINCEVSGMDGTSYVVEINKDQTYRTYKFSASAEKCREAKQMQQIGEIIAEEFDFGEAECKTAEWFLCSRLPKQAGNETANSQIQGNLSPPSKIPLTQINLAKIGPVAPKGRVQDKDYNNLAIIEQLIAQGKDSIPFLISKLDDETKIKDHVFDYWHEVRVADVALTILGDFFTDKSWTNSTISSADLYDSQHTGHAPDLTAEENLRNYLAKYGRKTIKKRWQRIWNENKENIYWDDADRCFKVKAQ